MLDREIELISYDTQSNIQLYTQFATQAAAGDRADVVHGGITSASREAVRPTLAHFGTLYFYNTQYEGGVCDMNCFNTGSTPGQTVQKLIPHVMERWGRKVYIVAADYNYGQITAQWVRKFVADNGGETVAAEFFPLDVTTFGQTIQKIQAAAPDLVVSVLVGGAHVSFYRQYAAAGMNARVPIASTTFGVGNEHKLVSAEEGDGMVCAYGYFEEIESRGQPRLHGALSRVHGRQSAGAERTRSAFLRGDHAVGRGGASGRHGRARSGDRGAAQPGFLRWPLGRDGDRSAEPTMSR